MLLKGEVLCKFAVISKTQKCLSVSRNKEIIVSVVVNNFYHPSAIKMSISASGQRRSRLVWIET